MKRILKQIAMILTIVLTISFLVGCGEQAAEGEYIDQTKSFKIALPGKWIVDKESEKGQIQFYTEEKPVTVSVGLIPLERLDNQQATSLDHYIELVEGNFLKQTLELGEATPLEDVVVDNIKAAKAYTISVDFGEIEEGLGEVTKIYFVYLQGEKGYYMLNFMAEEPDYSSYIDVIKEAVKTFKEL